MNPFVGKGAFCAKDTAIILRFFANMPNLRKWFVSEIKCGIMAVEAVNPAAPSHAGILHYFTQQKGLQAWQHQKNSSFLIWTALSTAPTLSP
ncbi:hypothetical protein [Faecalispora sporosphaeroides]|uniref:hypothetical protein n=1 Tax=Faecalispora sporosphaeroides TaxID=1549 RepID=UPI002DD6A689|nr:hypothetical protein [Faecalispora sporosphaeroides]